MSDLFCVSHYGWYNGYDHFEGYVGDGVTSPSQELVGVYDTKKQAEKGLKAAEAEDERDKPGYPDCHWRYRALAVQPFRPADFATRQMIADSDIDSVSRDIVRLAVEEGLWHSKADPSSAVQTFLIVYALLDVSTCKTYADVYTRLDSWSQDMAGSEHWDDCFEEYDDDSWEVNEKDVRRVLGRGKDNTPVESEGQRLFRLVYSRNDDNIWTEEGVYEIERDPERSYDLLYDLDQED